MEKRKLHVVHLSIRHEIDGQVVFLLYPHPHWNMPEGRPYLSMPTKKTVTDPDAPAIAGTSVEGYIDTVAREDLGLADAHYVIGQELEPAVCSMTSPTRNEPTDYLIYTVDVWVPPAQRERLRRRLSGEWLTIEEALQRKNLSPTARAALKLIKEREGRLEKLYAEKPAEAGDPEAGRYMLEGVPPSPLMDDLAKKWLSRNRRGARVLTRKDLTAILDAGDRAFNLRVADPYLRYQMQGSGFTWSFFTHKDNQDLHVHGAPVVEIYGVLKGRMEIWWKPYHDRGTSAWFHRVLEAGDWVEVDSLHCHIVRWRKPGMGVVFKAGPGPLAGLGRLGVAGKTKCGACHCILPPEVEEIIATQGRLKEG